MLGALCLLGFVAVVIEAANLPTSEIDALHDLYIATHGDYWRWSHTSVSGIPWEFSAACNPCVDGWQGLNCTSLLSDGFLHVAILELAAHNLTGTIPVSLKDLTQIQILYLPNNHLSGSIPVELSYLQAMTDLDLGDNRVTGTIPPELASLQSINTLELHFNYLSGSIPAELGSSLTLATLLLDSNYLTGTIPIELGNLQTTVFVQLALDVNRLSGTIPPELANLHALTYLALSTNHFTGTIPPQLGQLTAMLDLYILQNPLTGTLPTELGNLQQLQAFYAYDSYLTGTIPASIGSIVSLVDLSLQQNMLTSTVPDSFKQLHWLNFLLLNENKLSGSISQFIDPSLQTAITILKLNSNRFTGLIPADLFALPQLLTVVLGENCFSGSLPKAICIAPCLSTLSMDGLHSAPSCRHKLFPGTKLHAFLLTDYIEDAIPTCLFEMPKLNTLHLSGNGLLGSLPDNVSISADLVDLALSYNKLTGSIPAVFQDRIWYNLDLSYNKFTGTLADKFATVPGNMSVMAHLGLTVVNGTQDEYNNPYGATILRNNRLSQAIPPVFDGMHNVSILKGNVFDCALNQQDLPQHDSGRPTYSCGSNAFNVPYYVYLGALFAGLCITTTLYSRRRWWLETTTSAIMCSMLNKVYLWAHVVQEYETQAAAAEQPRPLQKYKYVLQLMNLLCEKAAVCTLYIVIVGIPLYATVSNYYGTHTYAYAWSVSAAYLSGVNAQALQMTFLCVLLVLLLGLHASLVRTIERSGVYQRAAPALVLTLALWKSLGIYSALFFVNSVVVGGANIGFVLAATNGDALAQAFAQIALSVFKLLWSNFGLTYLMRWAQQRLTAFDARNENGTTNAFFGLQLFVQLYNLIIVPCVVTALLSPDCFNSAIVAAPTVTTHFTYSYCRLFVTSSNICIHYETVGGTSTYDPPFTYSYQCSSSLITYYAPTFVYTGLIATFVNPVLSWAQRTVYLRVQASSPWLRLLKLFVPRIQRPIGEASVTLDKSYNPLRPYWDANHRCILLLTYLGVLLTFGLVFPPLALVMLTTMYSAVWLWRLEVGRFLSDALTSNVHKYSEIIDAECEGVGSVPRLHRAARVLGWVVCAFYAPFMFDTLGDAQGAKRSIWVLIVTPLLPAVVLFAAFCHAQWRRMSPAGQDKGAEPTRSVDIELNAVDRHREAQAKIKPEAVGEAPVFNILVQPPL